MPKKQTFDEFKETREYQIWELVYNKAVDLDINVSTFLHDPAKTSEYWEPFLVLLFKMGNIFKQTKKLKEIKASYMKTLVYIGSDLTGKLTFEGTEYTIDKGAMHACTNVSGAFRELITDIHKFPELKEDNFKQTFLGMKKNCSDYFNYLNTYVKDGWRAIHENFKQILLPLRKLRKSAYRLVSLEKSEAMNYDLTMFNDRKNLKEFNEKIKEFFESEDYKMKKDCDLKELDNQLGYMLDRNFYEYVYEDKIRKPELNAEDDKEKAKKDKEEKKKLEPRKKQQEKEEEELKMKEEKERKELTYVNIKELKQQPPTRFIREAFQKDFEDGIDAILEYLVKFDGQNFPSRIQAHKIFVNLKYIENWRTIPQLTFYLKKLYDQIEIMKIKLYEMKLNGTARLIIPIKDNTEIVSLIKNVYDSHEIINTILGDKLLYDQFMFIYDKIKMITHSNLKDDLERFKTKQLIEYNIPRYIFFMSLCYSAEILNKMIENSRKDGGHYEITDYYQPTKYDIDTEDNLINNAYELTEDLKIGMNEETTQKMKLLWDEIKKYGRFWLMEGNFPKEDKQKWLDCINVLVTINTLVREDIRDMILLNYDEKLKNEITITAETNNTAANIPSANRVTSERKTGKKMSKIVKPKQPTKEPSAKKGNIKRKNSSRRNSFDSEEILGGGGVKKLENLRPPLVWNFPIERVVKMKNENLIKEKKEIPKDEIRKVNPFLCYHDHRVEKFMTLFDEIFKNAMTHCLKLGNIWQYKYEKILNIFNIDYQFEKVVVGDDAPKTNVEGEEDNNKDETKVESKEESKVEKKEESKEENKEENKEDIKDENKEDIKDENKEDVKDEK